MARLAMPSRGDRCLRPGGARRGFTERRDRPTLATARAADAHRRRRQAGVAERRLRERGADRRAQDGAAHRAPPLRRAAVARSLHLRSCADVLRRCARGAAATLPLRARVHRILQPALLPWAAAAMPPAASLAPPRPAPAARQRPRPTRWRRARWCPTWPRRSRSTASSGCATRPWVSSHSADWSRRGCCVLYSSTRSPTRSSRATAWWWAMQRPSRVTSET
mmetsp:Transcript_29332/g.72291  ORF Transcript_29332/g.72291 Transcript_29332/m.72291 type:complete len:222 (-) Transcript_29332:1031-1696(-)